LTDEIADSELLARIADGDHDAFNCLVRRHQGRVLSLAYRFSRDPQDAEELAQEIFFKVWRHARTFRGRAAFSTWLYRLAVNACLNHRQRKKRTPDPLMLPDDLADPEQPTADRGRSVGERERLLEQAMAELPARQKTALILAVFEGNSYEEIASIMDISLSAVETLLFRARQNLGKKMRPLKK
jgi:RNA polymerase sigma-70 factor (ECF subfamily)